MQITRVFVVLATLLVVGYAAIEPLDLKAEESRISSEHTRQKRGLIAAKLGLLGGALVAKKALLLGAGAGIAGGLAGATVYKLKLGYGGGYPGLHGGIYPGGYFGGYPGGYGGVYPGGYGGRYLGGYGGGYPNGGYYPSDGYYPTYSGGSNLGEGVYPGGYSGGQYPKKAYIYGGISGGYESGYGNGYNNYQPC